MNFSINGQSKCCGSFTRWLSGCDGVWGTWTAQVSPQKVQMNLIPVGRVLVSPPLNLHLQNDKYHSLVPATSQKQPQGWLYKQEPPITWIRGKIEKLTWKRCFCEITRKWSQRMKFLVEFEKKLEYKDPLEKSTVHLKSIASQRIL